MSDLLKDKIGRWSLDRIQFLLGHIESFVEDENAELRERARSFSAQTGLEKIERLVSADPSDPSLPRLVLENLTPFFEAGLLVQRGPDPDHPNWWVTDLAWRGNTFHLELADQLRASTLVPEITPLQVHRADAPAVLAQLAMPFLKLANDTQAYLLRPTPSTAYVLFSRLPAPWAPDHVANAHKLVNKSFLY